MRKFVGQSIAPAGDAFIASASGSEPPVPRAFRWNDRTFDVCAVLRSWRTTKADRGDVYLKRHWFEIETAAGERLEVYFDREARRGAPRWWLYTLTTGPDG